MNKETTLKLFLTKEQWMAFAKHHANAQKSASCNTAEKENA